MDGDEAAEILERAIVNVETLAARAGALHAIIDRASATLSGVVRDAILRSCEVLEAVGRGEEAIGLARSYHTVESALAILAGAGPVDSGGATG